MVSRSRVLLLQQFLLWLEVAMHTGLCLSCSDYGMYWYVLLDVLLDVRDCQEYKVEAAAKGVIYALISYLLGSREITVGNDRIMLIASLVPVRGNLIAMRPN